MAAVDLNIDLGELSDEPEELYALASVANIACGGHAGDEASMRAAAARARRHGTRVAAHPSYPDRANFGRATLQMEPAELYQCIVDQVSDLAAALKAAATELFAVKAHGALYHVAAADPTIGAALLDGAVAAWPTLRVVVGPPYGVLAEESRERSLEYAREGFADRGYDASGKLLPRGAPGALLEDPNACAEQAVKLARAGTVETICVHGDGPAALATARAVRARLEREGLLRAR